MSTNAINVLAMPEGGKFPEPPPEQSLGRLAAALAKAQASMKPAKKDSENPFFKSNYADLAAIWEACREPLSTNGLAVLQFVQAGELVTALIHTSGERVDSRMAIQAKKDGDVQSFGSTLTYLRRYALAALVGVVADGEDDDGNASTGRSKNEPAKRESRSPRTERAPAAPIPGDVSDPTMCPACGTQGKPQAYPKPDKTHFCPSCAHAWGVPA